MAIEKEMKKIAFPSISTGIYHFPVELAAKTAVAEVKKFMEEYDGDLDEIIWVLFDENTKAAYDKAIQEAFEEYGLL